MDYLKLAASPVFLTAALLTELQPTSLCLTDTPIFKEMTIMYLLMALFHAPAWREKRIEKD
jgi:hypothetical protein